MLGINRNKSHKCLTNHKTSTAGYKTEAAYLPNRDPLENIFGNFSAG